MDFKLSRVEPVFGFDGPEHYSVMLSATHFENGERSHSFANFTVRLPAQEAEAMTLKQLEQAAIAVAKTMAP